MTLAQCGKTRNSLSSKIFREINSLVKEHCFHESLVKSITVILAQCRKIQDSLQHDKYLVFREIDYQLCNNLSKTLLSRNFCQKMVRENCHAHSVEK